jgi:transposase
LARASRTRPWNPQACCENPVFNILAERLEVLVVNARHVKAVPGRTTDVADSEWLADLLQHGLLRASFLPDRGQRDLRDLTRTRTSLIDERSRTVRRLQKVLEDANIKLSSVATDSMGVSGRAILGALVDGTTDAAVLADLARGKLRTKRPALARASSGRLSDHHRLLLATHLAQVDFQDEAIHQLSQTIAERLAPVEEVLQRLETIPGVKRRTVEGLAAETGLDMPRFPSAGHLASWAGVRPGSYESAGKRKGGKPPRQQVAASGCAELSSRPVARRRVPGAVPSMPNTDDSPPAAAPTKPPLAARTPLATSAPSIKKSASAHASNVVPSNNSSNSAATSRSPRLTLPPEPVFHLRVMKKTHFDWCGPNRPASACSSVARLS